MALTIVISQPQRVTRPHPVSVGEHIEAQVGLLIVVGKQLGWIQAQVGALGHGQDRGKPGFGGEGDRSHTCSPGLVGGYVVKEGCIVPNLGLLLFTGQPVRVTGPRPGRG